MSYVCAYSSVQLDKSRVEKEFTSSPQQTRIVSDYGPMRFHGRGMNQVYGQGAITLSFSCQGQRIRLNIPTIIRLRPIEPTNVYHREKIASETDWRFSSYKHISYPKKVQK